MVTMLWQHDGRWEGVGRVGILLRALYFQERKGRVVRNHGDDNNDVMVIMIKQ